MKGNAAQWGAVSLVLAACAGSVLYKVLMHEQMGHSAAMFIGIPAVLAILLASSPQAKTATGAILKGITLCLLVAAPLLGEGYLCILIASPIFYIVGIVIGLAMDHFRQKRNATLSCLVLILLPMSFEGVGPQLALNRAQSAEATKTVNLAAGSVEQELAQSLRVQTRLPKFLQAGFPRPLSAWGSGLSVGDTRTIHFSGAEGDPPGDLVLRVAERRPGYVRFETVTDGSKLTQWLRWTSSEVAWKAVDANRTAVTWRIHFERQLDPAWYFAVWEQVAVREAAAYLIDAQAASAEGE